MVTISLDTHQKARTPQINENIKDYVTDNIIVNGVSWK